MTEGRLNTDKFLEDVGRRMDAAVGKTPDPAPRPREATETRAPASAGAQEIITANRAALEMIVRSIKDRTNRVRRALDIIDAEADKDFADTTSRLAAHVASSEALARQVDEMEKLTEDIRAKRATLIEGRGANGAS